MIFTKKGRKCPQTIDKENANKSLLNYMFNRNIKNFSFPSIKKKKDLLYAFSFFLPTTRHENFYRYTSIDIDSDPWHPLVLKRVNKVF